MKSPFKINRYKKFLKLEGKANDLLQISNNGEMKQTRLFYLMPENIEEDNQEVIDVTVTSTNPYKSFPIFDNIIGKKIRITIEVKE